MIGCYDHDVPSGLACPVTKGGGLIQLHGKAIVRRETMRDVAERHFDAAFPDPDLLVDIHVASARFIGNSRACGQHDLDDLNG
jgi:hypothetical protein